MNEYAALQHEVYEANMAIPRERLAKLTWGNVSGLDPERGVFAIKPSGVDYEALTPEDIVVVDLDARVVHGTRRPSSDTRTHAVLYRAFPDIRGIVHTHSPWAVGWAQALCPIPIFGTTHADQTTIDIPCTPPMADERVAGDYEEETGNQIVEHFRDHGLDPAEVPMVLVGCHGPFAWGRTIQKAVENAIALEEIAKMAAITRAVNPQAARLPEALRRKHWERKHGKDAYYGQG
jgi:L-ribulose-5-phosphate 4-epimerase